VPIINIGLELQQNERSFCTSDDERKSFEYISLAIFAPNGYPDKIPKIKTKTDCGGSLNSFTKVLLKKSGKIMMLIFFVIMEDRKIKGNTEGITLLNQIKRPPFAASIISFGKTSMNISKQKAA